MDHQGALGGQAVDQDLEELATLAVGHRVDDPGQDDPAEGGRFDGPQVLEHPLLAQVGPVELGPVHRLGPRVDAVGVHPLGGEHPHQPPVPGGGVEDPARCRLEGRQGVGHPPGVGVVPAGRLDHGGRRNLLGVEL